MKTICLLFLLTFSPFILDAQEEKNLDLLTYNGVTFNSIQFQKKSITELSDQGKQSYNKLVEFLINNDNVIIELFTLLEKKSSSNEKFVNQRNKKIKEMILVDHPLFSDRITLKGAEIIKKTAKNVADGNVGFRVTNTDYFPCSGSSIVNFDKATNKIIETRCDSLSFIAKYIKLQSGDNFMIIGIYSDPDDDEEKFKALERAERVKENLVKLGVESDQLRLSLSYLKKPAKNEPRDWPFYPNQYTYEIGVYVNQDYQY